MALLDQSYTLNEPSVISDEVGGETLAIHLDSGAYFVFPNPSLPVWKAITAGVPPQRLLDSPDDPRAGALQSYVGRLLELQLIRTADVVSVRSDLPQWQVEDLTVAEYTDMADLLGPDPIHDADKDLGWPLLRDGGR